MDTHERRTLIPPEAVEALKEFAATLPQATPRYDAMLAELAACKAHLLDAIAQRTRFNPHQILACAYAAIDDYYGPNTYAAKEHSVAWLDDVLASGAPEGPIEVEAIRISEGDAALLEQIRGNAERVARGG